MSAIGRIAYEAYSRHSDGKSLVSGDLLPLWPEMPLHIRQAWDAAAGAVAAAGEGPPLDDDDE